MILLVLVFLILKYWRELLIPFIIIFFILIIAYFVKNYLLWKRIEEWNQEVGINRKNVFIDKLGYLRWKETQQLCHRDIAWKHNIRGDTNFSDCDIHHKDGNKLNNNPKNLEALQRLDHQIEHKQVIIIDGKKYRKLARTSKIYRSTARAHLIANTWIPKSQVIIENGYIYIPEWLYKEKGLFE